VESKPSTIVNPIDDSNGGFEHCVYVCGHCDDGPERELRLRGWEVGSVNPVNISELLCDGRPDGCRWIGRSKRIVTQDLDAAVVQIEPDSVGNFPEIRSIE
jgi:hypothetical protein